MSNPFAVFRKNRNYWMAGLVLLAILAFVVAPAIDQASQAFRGSGGENATVVRWDGGKITRADLSNAMQKHGQLVRFLSLLAQEVIDSGGQPQVPGFAYDSQSQQIMSLGIQTGGSEMDLCRTRIRANYAKRLGIELDDRAIDEYILAFCDNRVSSERLREILFEATDGRLSNYELREQLKQELAAIILLQTARSGLAPHTPGELFQNFAKLNRTAQVEAFPVFVEDYVSQVTGEPSPAEIQAIYEAGIGRIPNPNSPQPGFARPYRANVEYVEANMQNWIDREKEKLTEEQIRAEYERRVELGQLQVPVEADAAEGDAPAEGASSEPQSPSSLPATSEIRPPSPSNQPSEPAASTDTPTESPTEDEGAATEDNPRENGDRETETPSNDDQDAGQDSDSDTTDSDSTEPAPDAADQASIAAEPVQFVAFLPQQERDDLPPPVVQPPQLGAGDTDSSADNQPAGTSGDGGDGSTVATPAGATADPAATQSPEMRTQTFEEARDSIADSLASEVAAPALRQALDELYEGVMRRYYNEYRQYVAFRDSEAEVQGEGVEEPAKPNLQQEAEKRGLTYATTGLTDGFTLMQTQFGQGSNVQDGNSTVGNSVAEVVSNPRVDLYRPLKSIYFDQSAFQQGRMPEFFQYLFWKTEEAEAAMPELNEVREEVIDAWKIQQARRLAADAADKLAASIKPSSEAPWEAALGTAEQSLVIEPEPFTWMSQGQFIEPSIVPRLDSVGESFMARVFSAEEGQAVVAPNNGETVFYVVRLEQFSPDMNDLQERFNADPIKSGAITLARQESDMMVINWYENLEQELNVEWQMSFDEF